MATGGYTSRVCQKGSEIYFDSELEIKGVKRPVRWACQHPTNPDGSLTTRLKKDSDSRWRKGV